MRTGTLPDFNEFGNLPSGIHPATIEGVITPARKIRTLAHTSPTRQRGKSQGTLAGASGCYVGPADVGVCASGAPAGPSLVRRTGV
jgi:hypothetical protein